MISAPSEMRCRSMFATSMTANTIASVSGIASATTVPGPHAEADEAAGEDDHDRLPERGQEFVDRGVHGDRLVGHQHGLDADRQVGLDVGHLAAHVLAQRQDVAGVPHRDGEPDRRLPVDAEHGLRRIDGAAAHGGDVAQPEDAPADDDVDRLDVGRGIERAGDAQEDALLLALDRARRAHDVLRLQRGEDGTHVQAQSSQALGRELQVDLLVLRAEHLDLRDVRDVQQPRADRFHVVAQFAEAEAVGGEGVDDAERAAEVVVEERTRRRPAAACRACRRCSCAPGTRCPALRPAAWTASGRRRSSSGRRWCSCAPGRDSRFPAACVRAARLPAASSRRRWRRARQRRRPSCET